MRSRDNCSNDSRSHVEHNLESRIKDKNKGRVIYEPYLFIHLISVTKYDVSSNETGNESVRLVYFSTIKLFLKQKY